MGLGKRTKTTDWSPRRRVLGIVTGLVLVIALGGAGTLIARHLFAEFQGMPVRLLEFVAVR